MKIAHGKLKKGCENERRKGVSEKGNLHMKILKGMWKWNKKGREFPIDLIKICLYFLSG